MVIEAAIKQCNKMQHETQTARNFFVSAGQHPWKECPNKEFKTRPGNHSKKLPCYGRHKSAAHGLEQMAIESRSNVVFERALGAEDGEEETWKEVVTRRRLQIRRG